MRVSHAFPCLLGAIYPACLLAQVAHARPLAFSGVLAKVVATLEAQLASARQEKDSAAEAWRAEKRTMERLHKELERQARELEKARDKALAEATEASAGRRRAQEALDASRRSDGEVVRSLQAEKAGMAKELRELKSSGMGDGGVGDLVSSVTALQHALGTGTPDDLGQQLKAARDAREDAEAKLDALRTTLRTELLRVTDEKEAALTELEVARGGETLELQRVRAELEAVRTACEEQRASAASLRGELTAERAAKDKLLVQARLDQASATSREREHAQQLSAKDVQLSALERELSSIAGQLVAAQAEVRQLQASADREADMSVRERSSLLQAQQALESDKSMLEAQLQGAEQQRTTLVEQISQCAADREFCFEIIRDLKTQLVAATRMGGSGGGGGGSGLQEVRL